LPGPSIFWFSFFLHRPPPSGVLFWLTPIFIFPRPYVPRAPTPRLDAVTSTQVEEPIGLPARRFRAILSRMESPYLSDFSVFFTLKLRLVVNEYDRSVFPCLFPLDNSDFSSPPPVGLTFIPPDFRRAFSLSLFFCILSFYFFSFPCRFSPLLNAPFLTQTL